MLCTPFAVEKHLTTSFTLLLLESFVTGINTSSFPGNYSRLSDKRRGRDFQRKFPEFTKSVWSFPAESAKKIGHPAPFLAELPYRLIQLYTFSNEIILDPFMGSGQTALAAIKANRHYVGYETNEEYLVLAQKRIRQK